MKLSIRGPLIVLLAALFCHSIVKFLLHLDLNKRVYNHSPGSCSSVAAIERGAEDVEFLEDSCAIVSAGLKHPEDNRKDVLGRMYLYNISARTAWELKLNTKTLTTKNFFPHGISVFRGKGHPIIFVVNHRPKGDSVEVFSFDAREKQLNHLRTVKSPLFHSLEDVAALTKDKFYAVNTHYFKRKQLRNMEVYLTLPLGNLVYFDGKKTRLMQRWLPSPKGIAIDVSKKWLYVSAMAKEQIIIYHIEPDFNLTQHSTIDLYAAPDNIFVDPYKADLFVAVHPVKIRKIYHDDDPENTYSPSQILKIHGRPHKGNWTITQVYANDGAMMSSASVCVRIKDRLLIGSTYNKLLSCDVDFPDLL